MSSSRPARSARRRRWRSCPTAGSSINPDGTIPADNPFFGTASGQNRAIWALGLRNPFTFRRRAGDRPDLHQRCRGEHVGGAQRGVGRPGAGGLELRLARDRGGDERPALQDAVLRLRSRGRPLRDHRGRVLRPRDGELPGPVPQRLLLRRLLPGLDQEHRSVHQGGLDADRAERVAFAGGHRYRRGREPLPPRARPGQRAPRPLPGRRLAAVDQHPPAAGHRPGRPQRDVHGLGIGDPAVVVPVAARRGRHPGRDVILLHARRRPAVG
jgi:hypothetical protein